MTFDYMEIGGYGMKKWLSLCFLLALCMLFTACGSGESTSGANAGGEMMAADIIVHLEVNPSFDIYVNSNGTIKLIHCLNEDAKTVYADMDLTGIRYEIALEELLTAIHEEGFLSEGVKIHVEIQQKSTVTYDVSKFTDEILADFDADVAAVESEVKNEVVEVAAPEVNVITEPDLAKAMLLAEEQSVLMVSFHFFEDIYSDVQLYLDENDMIIWAWYSEEVAEDFQTLDIIGKNIKEVFFTVVDVGYTRGYFPEGSYLGHGVTADVHQSVATGPKVFRMMEQLNNWAEEYVWESQKYIAFRFDLHSDAWSQYSGVHVTIDKESDGIWWKAKKRYENGALREEEKISQYGDIQKRKWSEEGDLNGVLLYEYIALEDGTIREMKYDDQEQVYSFYEKFAEGTIVEVKQNQNTQGDGIYYYELRSDGTIFEIKYDNQGNRSYYEKLPDGTAHTVWYDVNGNIIKEE